MNYTPDPDHPLTTACPYFPPEEREWLKRELGEILAGKLSMGPRVRRFEEAFAALCGAAHGVAFPSGTSSLEAALLALGTKPGDEVLVPVETFVATGMAVHLAGATPVFVETSPEAFGMDFDDARRRLTPRTRGAVVVHFGGFIAPGIDRFAAELKSAGRFLIEDCAHAHGATLGGRPAGSFGDAGCFSFYPTKMMTTGEGGMLVTSDARLAAGARSLQNRGMDMDAGGELYVRAGRNNRFTEIAAALGLSQLRCLPDFLAARRRVAAVYDGVLRDGPFFRPLLPGPGAAPSYWRYTIVAERPFDRPALRDRLTARGVHVDWPYDPLLHLQPSLRALYGGAPGDRPVSEDLAARHLCLPMHARLRDADARYVAESVRDEARRLGGGA